MVRGSRRRFSFLDRALKSAGGTAAPGSRLGNYDEFKKGNRDYTVKNKIERADRAKFAIALLPFGLPNPANPTEEDYYRTTITKYSNDMRTEVITTLTNSELGYNPLVIGNNPGSNYYPSLLRLFVQANANTPTISQPTSQITGKKYSRIAGKTYSIPFGRKTGALTETQQQRRQDLVQIARTGAGTSKATGITFESEYFADTPNDAPGLP